MKKIFVTGGTGFIGKRIVSRLENTPDTMVYVLSRNRYNDANKIKYIKGDISDEKKLRVIMSDICPDTLLHLAWDVQTFDYVSSDTNKIWVERSETLARIFLECGGGNIISSGTCFEYDIERMNPHREDEPPAPNTLYGISKLQVMEKLEALCKKYDARFVWGRIFYPYGEGENPRKLMTAVRNALNQGNSFVCKTPENIIDYIHIDDIADIFIEFLFNDEINGVINVGSGEGKTVREILTSIASGCGKTHLLRFEKQEKVYYIVADTDKLKKMIH